MQVEFKGRGTGVCWHGGLSVGCCRGTWSWAAPETITGLKCTEKVDIWSYGIVLWELCTVEQPERGRNRPVRCTSCPATFLHPV